LLEPDEQVRSLLRMLASAFVVMVLMAEPTKEQRDVVRAVTKHIESAGRASLPDSGLLPAKGPLPLLAQLGGDGPPLTADMLTQPKQWKLHSNDEWQAAADKLGTSVYVAAIGLPEIEGELALVSVGVELMVPTGTPGLVLCCCNATDVYRRDSRGVWRFEKRGATVCA